MGVYFCFFLVMFKICLRLKVSAFVCFSTSLNVCVFTYVMFFHWRFYLWSYAWKVPPTSTLTPEITKISYINNSQLQRLTFTEYLTICQTLFQELCICYLNPPQKPCETFDVVTHFTNEETETQVGIQSHVVSSRDWNPIQII